MSKLTNLKGRINYISSHARQENLYGVYETTDRQFWNELVLYNQQEFANSGTAGKCIEARELIIVLPESFVEYDPKELLQCFTEHFKQNYGVECISALHHNKRKTNYHIHLIFSERKLLDEPIVKQAARNMFYDENGKHVRTKKEILDTNGQVRTGCKIISKGEIYEKIIFTKKDIQFKNEGFLNEVKRSYTDLINFNIQEEKDKLQVFDKNRVYLPMKKIGKNNPKANLVQKDNQMRMEWNRTVDRALVSGIPVDQIMVVKKNEINQKLKESIQKFGNKPLFFVDIIIMAIMVLELLIKKMLKLVVSEKKKEDTVQVHKVFVLSVEAKKAEKELIPEYPKKSIMASKYPQLSEIKNRLEEQNTAIYQIQLKLDRLEEDLTNMKGVLKWKKRAEIQNQIDSTNQQMENMKHYLSQIVKGYHYQNVKEFMRDYIISETEFKYYQKEVSDWGSRYGSKVELAGIGRKFHNYKEQEKEYDENARLSQKNNKGAR